MKVEVKGHWTTARNGERIYIETHKMRLNPKIHARHIRTLDRMIAGLEEQKHRRIRA